MYTIDTKQSGYNADTPEQVLSIIRDIRRAYDAKNEGKGYGIKVKVNGFTQTIGNWLLKSNALHCIQMVCKK